MVTVWTVGHSTRTQQEVFSLLHENDVDTLIDVRSYPSSRYCPQWGQDSIIAGMAGQSLVSGDSLTYQHMPLLGGKRKALPARESVNGAWRNDSFRGYADYMQTEEFSSGLRDLVDLAQHSRIAIMCSEAVWWRCHRSMIADALVAEGYEVEHIMAYERTSRHKLREFAQINSDRPWGNKLTYPTL